MEIAKLKHQITKLTTENKRLTTKFMKIKTTITPVMISSHFAKSPSMAAFMLMQFNRYDNLHSNAHYSPLEQTICISILHSCKQNGYRTLQNLGLKLADLSTIRRWLKKILSKIECQTCLSMLEFRSQRETPKLAEDETLLLHRSFSDDILENEDNLCYAHLLKPEMKEMFHALNRRFGDNLCSSLNLGTNVMRNLVRKLKELPIVSDFFNADGNSQCQGYHRQMLELFLRAGIYRYFEQKSDELRSYQAKSDGKVDSAV